MISRWFRGALGLAVGSAAIIPIVGTSAPVLAATRLVAEQTQCIDGELPDGRVIPAGAVVTATVTGIRPDRIGFISLHAPDRPFDETTSVNINPGLNLANTTSYTAGDDGGICITSSVATHATIDIVGFEAVSSGVAVDERLFDSRSTGRLAPAEPTCFDGDLASGVTIPPGAVVTATVTGIQPDRRGFLSLHAPGRPFDETTSVNINPGLNLANTTSYTAGDDGGICITSSVAAHATIDIVSVDDASTAVPIDERLYDSRDEGFTIGPNIFFNLTWKCIDPDLPSGTVIPEGSTVIATITGVQPEGIGYLNFTQPGDPPDVVTSVNVASGLNIANTTVFQAEDDICVHASTPTHATVDVVSYDESGAMTFINQRVFDSRDSTPLADPVAGPTAPVFVSGDASLAERVTVSCRQGTLRRAGDPTEYPITTLEIEISGLTASTDPDVADVVKYHIRLVAPPVSVNGIASYNRDIAVLRGRGDGHSLIMRGSFDVSIDNELDSGGTTGAASFDVPGVLCEPASS